MLVPGMQLSEIRKEIEADRPAIVHKLISLTDKGLKQMRKTNMSRLHKSMDYISPRKNNWIIGYTFRAPSKDKSIVHYVAIMYIPGGFTVFYPPPNDPVIMLYTSHFFKRYNERLHLNLTDPKEKIRHFMLNGSETPYEKLEDVNENAFSFFARNQMGVLLGMHYKKENIAKFNTFLSEDMLKGSQVALSEKLKQVIDKYKNQNIID